MVNRAPRSLKGGETSGSGSWLECQGQISGRLCFGEAFLETLHFPASSFFFFFFLKNIYLAVPGLSWGVWDPVPRAGVKPGPPASGAGRLGHWTTTEVPKNEF